MAEHLTLKWGTLKGWDVREDGQAIFALKRFADLGMAMGAAQQQMTDAHRDALCDAIDALDGTITNDWTGETLTKDQAKAYVREYRR